MPQEPNEQFPEHQHTDSDFDQAALTAPVAQPAAATPDHEPQPWLQPAPQKSSKKKPIIALIIAAFIVLTGGGYAAYALWYQSPDKVVLDAIANLVTAKTASVTGSYSGTDEKASYVMSFEGKGGYKEGAIGSAKVTYTPKDNAEVKLDVAGIHGSNGDNYVKIGNLKQIFAPMIAQLQQTGGTSSSPLASKQMASLYTAFLQPLIDRVDNKWLKFSANDLKKISAKNGETYECLEEATKSLNGDYGKLIELGIIYQKNNFFVIKQSLGTKNGNIGYLVTIDNGKLSKFVEELQTSKFYKDLKSCPRAFDVSALSKNKEAGRVELWIDQWSHQLRAVHAEEKGKMTFDMQLIFNQPVTVETPQSSVSVNAVLGEFEQVFGGSFANSLLKTN